MATNNIINAPIPFSLANGGTGASLTASNGGIVWSNATTLSILAGTATANQMLQSGANTTPHWSTATWPVTTTINQLLYSSAANTVAGLSTANSAILRTNATGVPSFSASMTNGQFVIGSTGATPVNATLTAGVGITITNGAGSVTIASNGADPWVNATTNTIMVVNTGYTANSGGTMDFTLPSAATYGDWVEINGNNLIMWNILQVTGQQIVFGNVQTTLGTGGSLASTLASDNIKLRCINNTGSLWTVTWAFGNITYV